MTDDKEILSVLYRQAEASSEFIGCILPQVEDERKREELQREMREYVSVKVVSGEMLKKRNCEMKNTDKEDEPIPNISGNPMNLVLQSHNDNLEKLKEKEFDYRESKNDPKVVALFSEVIEKEERNIDNIRSIII